MPFSFTQIEKDKTNKIGFVFFFLIAFYFVVALLLYCTTKFYFIYESSRRYEDIGIDFSNLLTVNEILATLGIALVVGFLHFFISVAGVIRKMLDVIGAKPLNPSDVYHIKFQNILDEVSIATGGKKVTGVVIPTVSCNAFAAADFNGNAVIGVTEGLLNRLTRSQLESVVAHEMAHIMTGDCLETTVVTSMFALYGDLLSGMSSALQGSRGNRRGIGLFFILYIILIITMFIATLMKMFISREREYRADAIAVRLTRDPLSLAQALYLISKRWRGAGIHGEQMSSMFIVAPRFSELDEREDFFSNLFSTHPPVAHRIDILLNMARVDLKSLESLDQQDVFKTQAPETAGQGTVAVENGLNQWEIFNDGVWRGPFDIGQLMSLPFITVDAFIRKAGTQNAVRLFEAKEVKEYNKKIGIKTQSINCPVCQINLQEDLYKGAPILRCNQCSGSLLFEDDVSKIISREDYFFSDQIHRLGNALIQRQNSMQIRSVDLKTANLLECPRCPVPKPKMLRNFYTLVYPVEVDRCITCHSVWFDKTELEVLQYLIGKNRASK